MSISICLITTAVCLSVDICALRILESDLSRDTAFTSLLGRKSTTSPLVNEKLTEITHVCVDKCLEFRL